MFQFITHNNLTLYVNSGNGYKEFEVKSWDGEISIPTCKEFMSEF